MSTAPIELQPLPASPADIFSLPPPPTPLKPSASDQLPVELLQEIFSHLSPHEYDAARLVSRRWFAASLYARHLLALLHTLRTLDAYKASLHSPPSRTTIHNEDFGAASVKNAQVCEFCDIGHCAVVKAHEREDLGALRAAFAAELELWPGSRTKAAVGRLGLVTSGLLEPAEPGVEMGIEAMAFSRCAGDFVGSITTARRKGSDGKYTVLARKLWIHRLFSFRHSTFGDRPRGPLGVLCDVGRCFPGQLFMTLPLSIAGTASVTSLRLEEHAAFSTVRQIGVSWSDGKTETVTFQRFKPVKMVPENFLGDARSGTEFYDKDGITYRRRDRDPSSSSSSSSTSSPTLTTKPRFFRGPSLPGGFWGNGKNRRRIRGDSVFYAPPPQDRENSVKPGFADLVLVRVGNSPLEVCWRISVPLPAYQFARSSSAAPAIPSPSSPTASPASECRITVLLTPAQEIWITRPAPASTSPLTAHYCLTPPPSPDRQRGRVSHLSVAPQHFWDHARCTWYFAVAAAYASGEVFMWRIDVSSLILTPAAIAPPKEPDPVMTLPPLVRIVARDLAARSKGKGMQTAEMHEERGLMPGDFEACYGGCVDVATGEVRVARDQAKGMEKLQVVRRGVWPEVRAWVVGRWASGSEDGEGRGEAGEIEDLCWVGKGMTLLVASRSEVNVMDMRFWRGWERGVLKRGFSQM